MPEFNKFEDRTESAQFQAAVGGGAGPETEMIAILVPPNETFVLSHFGNEVNDARAWGVMRWRILVDGAPARNYYDIKDQLGAFNLPREIPFGYITAQREIRVYIQHTGFAADGTTPDANTYKAGVTIKGAYVKND